MASKIQHVVCVSVSSVICTVVNVKAEGASVIIVGLPQVTSVYKMSSVGKLHKYTVISDLRYTSVLSSTWLISAAHCFNQFDGCL
uniref:Uncharacterized protein n=1 Tax=Cynoglossus semilaevis TaxID=244447 RepID=A0A3P8WFQ0_CYNSE